MLLLRIKFEVFYLYFWKLECIVIGLGGLFDCGWFFLKGMVYVVYWLFCYDSGRVWIQFLGLLKAIGVLLSTVE